jgi:hypothetical protein
MRTNHVSMMASLGALALLAAGCGSAVVGAECVEGLDACGHECVYLSSDPQHCGACDTRCDEGWVCEDGACVSSCPNEWETFCDGSCLDLSSDPENCGECGHACPPETSCVRGECGLCPPDLTDCDGACVDTDSDPDHCGQCDTACGSTQVCSFGSCGGECDPGLSLCGDACVDIGSDPDHCGGCFEPCPDGLVCVEGTCTEDCPPPSAECGRVCVDLTSDDANCGWCFHGCGDGESCIDGDCVGGCANGMPRCGGVCTDLTSDEHNCGNCGVVCESGELCLSGTCEEPCAIDHLQCDGDCISPETDPINCGGCGIACATDEFCAAGACVASCPDGLVACGGRCVDTISDPDHCGGCFYACETGLCVDGTCIAPEVGHVVLIGHNYRIARAAQQRLLGNAVLLPLGGGEAGEVRVLVYDGFAPSGRGSAAAGVDAAIDAVAASTGQSWSRTTLADPIELPSEIGHHDTLLIYEQSEASDEELQELGAAWASTLWDFATSGGVIVVVDGGTGNSGTWQLLASAGLADVTGIVGATRSRARIIRAADAIARSVPMTYNAEADSVSFETSETDVVAENDDGPIALHLTYAPE